MWIYQVRQQMEKVTKILSSQLVEGSSRKMSKECAQKLLYLTVPYCLKTLVAFWCVNYIRLKPCSRRTVFFYSYHNVFCSKFFTIFFLAEFSFFVQAMILIFGASRRFVRWDFPNVTIAVVFIYFLHRLVNYTRPEVGKTEIRESFNFLPYEKNVWGSNLFFIYPPESFPLQSVKEVADFYQDSNKLFDALHKLSLDVMDCLALGLGLDETKKDVFRESHRLVGTKQNTTKLRYLWYPPVQGTKEEMENHTRLGTHTDYGSSKYKCMRRGFQQK